MKPDKLPPKSICCDGKMGFDDEAEAVKVMRGMLRSKRAKGTLRPGPRTHTYLCPYCRKYHYGRKI